MFWQHFICLRQENMKTIIKHLLLKTSLGQKLRQLRHHNFMGVYQDNLAYSYLKHCSKILDVGCGTGRFISLNPKQIIGLDSNHQTLKLCRRKGYQVKYGSVIKLPYPAKSFTGLHCSHVLEHLQPQAVYQFLKEASRVLKTNGILIIRSPLLWKGFYDNLTHIKPYPPRAITRYLVENAPDTTLKKIPIKFKKVALHWRYQTLSFKKNGYTLILQKQT